MEKKYISERSTWEIPFHNIWPKLKHNIEADVVIVGAGITGLFNAYMLSKAGLRVVVIEKRPNILTDTTMYTTAFVTHVIDTDIRDLVTMVGKSKAKLAYQAGLDAIKKISEIIEKEHIECEHKKVSLYRYAKTEKELEDLRKEYEILKEAGFDIELKTHDKKISFHHSGVLEYKNQAMFHPIKFAKVLAEQAEANGAKIFADSKVIDIHKNTVRTKEGKVTAKHIIIATYYPLVHTKTHFKKGMYMSYVFEAEITKGVLPEGLYEDMHDPYHYFRVEAKNGFDRMIVGGEDHRKEIKINPEKNFKALEEYVKTILPNDFYNITRRWRSGVLEPSDGLPLIGKIKPNMYVATAFSGNGMTYAAISADLIQDLILGKANPYRGLYDPKRIPSFKSLLKKGRDYTRVFFGGAVKNLLKR